MLKCFLLILSLFLLTSSATWAQSKKSKKKAPKIEIPKGEMNPVDYIDTFKNSSLAKVKKVSIGKVMDSLEIRSTDNGKTLNIKSGEQFTPPADSYTEGWVNPKKTSFPKAFIKSKGIRVELIYKKKYKYYGILEFNKVYEACAGDPSARSYYIHISPSELVDATGGNTAVIFEHYDCAPRSGDKSIRDYTTSTQRYTSWVLWISDIPFE